MNTAPSGANKSALKKMDFSTILDLLISADQANRMIADLEKLAESVYLTGNKFSSNLKKIDVRYYQTLSELLGIKNKKEILRELIREIKNLPVVNVNLSFYPSFQLVEKMSDWLEENMGKKILISINKNTELFTKVEVEYKGKYGKF